MADNGSDTDVSSEHGDAWEHLAPSLPLDHPKAAAGCGSASTPRT